MFGLKKRSTKSSAPAAASLFTVPEILIRPVDVEWDHATLILTVSDHETGDLVAAAHGSTIVKATGIPVVSALNFMAMQSDESFAAVMASLKMVGIKMVSAGHGAQPFFIA